MPRPTSEHLWKETPLIHSDRISSIIGCSAFLKLENLHPSHSFKYRGISHFAQTAKEIHGTDVHLIIASGGNAGLAAACAAKALGVRCTVFIPEGVTASTLDLLKRQEAEVIVHGSFYLQALERAKEVVNSDEKAVMVPAYDDPTVWEGHSSMIAEISDQLQDKPDAIFCSVGGGGLLGGIITGCKKVGWDDVPIVAIETRGSDCFYHSIALNRQGVSHVLPPDVNLVEGDDSDVKLAFFNEFSSRASGSLGASSPSEGVVRMALRRGGGVVSASVPDELSMQVALAFADDHKMLVELSCSTTLTPAYKPGLFSTLVPDSPKKVVFIVCGGFKVSLEEMAIYKKLLDEDMTKSATWDILCDGRKFKVGK
ncbi:hypothetical protein HGRIS_013293 [Hohenbuehelia grisea]|uniref:L-serine ammonia-lyase n=1 Tax=Hohenbuehelia grisea TaxID=104357 RepID=A0ABR3IV26_9AGAR